MASLLFVTACPTPDPPTKRDLPSPTPEAFSAHAHREALETLLPLAERTHALHDPVSAAAIGFATIPRLPPVAAGRTAPLRKQLDEAWKEAEGIRGDLLGAAPSVLLGLTRFGLSRARADLVRRRPWRDDPTWVVVETERVVELLEADAADGTCDRCDDAMPALAEDVERTLADLGAASLPSTNAAAEDLAALAARVAALPDSEPARAALDRAHAQLVAIAAALPKATAWTHDRTAPPAASPTDVRRLPPRVPAAELRRRLEIAEDRDEDARDQFTRLGPVLARLKSMADARAPAIDRSKPTPVDVERCEAAWAPIAAHAKSQPGLARATLDCEAAVRRLAGRALRDAELTVALVDLGVVDPHRAARRAEEPPSLALVAGRIAPASQRHAFRLAVLSGLRDDAALLVALTEARAAACLAATALWIHGELGSDADLGTRLQQLCPDRPPAEWIAAAEARPLQSLHGLALERLDSGPAEIVPLDRYWWAPLGFVSLLAHPERAAPLPTRTDVDVKVEPL